jgi:hypothetical protein
MPLLIIGGIGLTVINGLQLGLDPGTDGLEAADVGASTADAAAEDAATAAEDAGAAGGPQRLVIGRVSDLQAPGSA